MKKKSMPDRKKVVRIRRLAYTSASLLFIVTLTAMCAVSFALPLRPEFSESEKRELAEFPEFSADALLNGDYFDGINLWFSDTFPMRDTFVKASTQIKTLLGVGQSVHHFSENDGDVIPDIPEEESQSIVDITPAVPETKSENDLLKPALPPSTTEKTPSKDNGNVLEQTLNSVYIYGNTAYEYYNFVRSTADDYVKAVNNGADEAAKNNINFYNMLVPTGIDITLNEEARSKLNSSDQKDAINYMNASMNENVKKVLIFDLLKAHSDEYIYFRTDHHWTALGAYYAYAQFMTVKGSEYIPLSDFTQYSFDGFLGSFYNDTNKNSALEKTPDTVYAYMPKGDISFSMMQEGSSDFIDWPLICDVTDYNPSYKYLCFIGGDNPVSVIENKSIEDGETCVFVKESFGNAFAPYLACNYKTVYVVDYRYFDGDITDFAKEKGASDIIVQSNVSMTRNPSLVKKLAETL
ncbi:MAG: hypothetical protein IKM66_07495 [Clostridia bacterium]|nr:hypothetical protein [Clostridia bacterium]